MNRLLIPNVVSKDNGELKHKLISTEHQNLEDCIICLEPIKYKILECGHNYHRKCLIENFKRNKKLECCYCSQPFTTKDVRKIRSIIIQNKFNKLTNQEVNNNRIPDVLFAALADENQYNDNIRNANTFVGQKIIGYVVCFLIYVILTTAILYGGKLI